MSDTRKRTRKGQASKGPLPPKITAFRYSTRNKTEAAYRDRLKVLKTRFGVPFTFAKSAKLTPQRKGAITRQTRKLTEFLNPENGFQFVPLTKKQNRGVKRNKEVSRQQVTGGGVFLPAPKTNDRRKRTKFKVSDDGKIQTRTGNFTSHFQLFRSTDVAADPGIIQRAAERMGAETAFVSIKGHRGAKRRKNGYSLKAFMRYLSEDIIPDIEEAQDDDDKKTAFRNWFGVEFVTYEWRAGTGATRKKKKTNQRKARK